MESKTIKTLKEMKKTSRHHYGNNTNSVTSMLKFLYYSGLCRNTFIVLAMALDNPIRPHELGPDITVLKPSIEELDLLREGRELTREFFYDRMHGVRRCYVALCEGEIAYIHWVYVKGDRNRFLRLADGVAELNYNTTIPRFRGHRLMGKMMAYIARDLRDEGFKRIVGVIHQKNPPALRNAEWAGMREIGRIKTFGPFNPVMPIGIS